MSLGVGQLPLYMFALFILSIVLLSNIFIPVYGAKSIVYVYIDSNGIAHVNMSCRLSPGLNEVVLPTQPIIPSLTVEANGRELPIVYNYTTNSVTVISGSEGVCTISYIVNATIVENRLAFNLSGKYMYRLILSPSIILLTLPNNITGFGTIGDMYYIDFDEGKNIQLLYIVKPQVSETTTSSKPLTTGAGLPLNTIIAVFGVGAIGVATFFLLRAVRRWREEEVALSELDIAILRSIEKRGGAVLQSELQKDLPSVPRTTLWRHVKKLERLGYVRVEKVGQQNRVVLIKRFR